MASRAKSISVDELSEKTAAVAREVLAGRIKEIGGKPGDISYFPDIGIFGLIWDDIDFDRFPAGPLLETSAKIAEGVGGFARVDIDPLVVIGKGGATMGYFPRIDELVLRKGGF